MFLILYYFFNDNSLKYYTGTMLFAAVMAFMGQPILLALGIYTMKHWNYFGSFLITILIAALARFITNKAAGTKTPDRRPQGSGDIHITKLNTAWLRRKAR